MAYSGIIKGSRTLDMHAIQLMIDAASLSFLAYSPEQLHIGIPIYAVIRLLFAVLGAYLRFQTTTPVGEKNV